MKWKSGTIFWIMSIEFDVEGEQIAEIPKKWVHIRDTMGPHPGYL